ncbi:recombinase family protein [Maledivibacter halophilus]|uniref:Site-specific DNA recombinase n=1 Tax=Maledivibacter halophilus TaxID=36842 RepID=A0A1T5KD58_9FIRM|nr:recombinase family protein [Maledivibacter halophilus]SKC61633.1 Site-specific DNA recombinase [Maledivibacter halophilus]
MNVCIYLRKSRAEENMSVEEVLSRHKTTLLAYSKKHDYNVLDIKEEVVSGESIARRPKMLELLGEVEDNKYDAVLVMDMDRLGRGNMREQGLILETFKEFNTKIITPRKTYDLTDEFDEEFSEFEAFMARRELKIIKKRLQRGRLKSLEEGNYISPYAPYGYDKKDKTLVINEDEANVVRLIFDLYVNHGYGDTKVARYLEDKKISNKHGNTAWDKTTIRKMIQNPVYIGKVAWNKRVYKYQPSGKRTSKFRNKDEWIIHEGKHKAIIDEDIFNKAQVLSKERYIPHVHVTKQIRNPLANLIKCGSCGATMTTRTAKGKKDSIRCYKSCGNKSSYIELVEERVLSIILDELKRIKYEFEREKAEINTTEIEVLKSSIRSSTREINTLKQQKEKLYDLLEQGIYDNDTFLNRMNTISQKIDTANNDINRLHRQLFKLKEDKYMESNKIPHINNSIELLENTYYNLSAEKRNKFLKTIIDKITYFKDKDASKSEFSLKVSLNI